MGWFKKKPDPITDRARALNDQIAALEAQIRQLDSKLGKDGEKAKAKEKEEHGPRLRSTTHPQGARAHLHPAHPPESPAPAPPPAPQEPIFEEVDQHQLQSPQEPESTREHYNDLGVRKYDLPALFRRIQNHFRGPSTPNPKLVNYLAAGSIQGLRPLRYEKRVARNRFIFFFALLFLGLLGIVVMILKRN